MASEGKIYSHKNQIELKSLYRNYCKGLDNENLDIKFDKEFQRETLLSQIRSDYEKRALNYNGWSPLILKSSDEGYLHYLAISLIFYPLYRINSYLTYHLENHHEPPATFCEYIREGVSGAIEIYSPFDNSIRLEKILDWALKARLVKYPKNGNTYLENRSHLKWTGNLTTLDILSKKIFLSSYTESGGAFTSVFIKYDKIIWKKEFKFLAFLLFELYEQNYINVEGLKNSKGYQQMANLYFSYHSDKKYASNYFSNTLSTLKRKKPHLYDVLLLKAKNLIASCK